MNAQEILNEASRHFYERNLDEAERHIRKLFRKTNNRKWRALAHLNYGILLQTQGKFAAADHSIKKALKLDPDSVEAVIARAVNKKFKKEEGYHLEIKRALNRRGLTRDQAVGLLFALAKVSDDIGNYDDAFEAAKIGNQLLWEVEDQDRYREGMGHYQNYIDELKDFCKRSEGINEQLNKYSRDTNIIFVLGLPRSGTTLLETLLAKHPEIEGLGEVKVLAYSYQHLCKMVGDPVNLSFKTMLRAKEEHIKRLADDFHSHCEKLSTGKRFWIDKTPNNFRYLPLIQMMYRNVKVLHVKRNPYDTLLSCYFQEFRDQQPWSMTLEGLADYYRIYKEITSHAEKELDLDIYGVQYEHLISDPEHTMKGVLHHLGLPFDKRCVTTGRDRVLTASMWQVQQPIYKSSVERWKNYEEHLQPLIERLDETQRKDAGRVC